MLQFSVIIPDLNTPTIDKAVQAVEHQDYDRSRFELIVVGMDEFGLVHESEVTHFDRSDSPLSPSLARNRGANQAKGEILVFTDADCIPHPTWLSMMNERFTSPDVDVIGGGVEFDCSNYWTLADNLSMFYEYLAIHPAGERQQLPSLNLAIRRNVFIEAGGFDQRYPRPAGEDADLTIRLRKSGHPLFFEPRATVLHAPPRNHLPDLLRHGYFQGQYSTKVDPRYASESGLPSFFRTRFGLIAASPLLPVLVVTHMFSTYPSLSSYWRTVPAILLAKLAWCFGAAKRPW